MFNIFPGFISLPGDRFGDMYSKTSNKDHFYRMQVLLRFIQCYWPE
jgi:hypothetical protein